MRPRNVLNFVSNFFKPNNSTRIASSFHTRYIQRFGSSSLAVFRYAENPSTKINSILIEYQNRLNESKKMYDLKEFSKARKSISALVGEFEAIKGRYFDKFFNLVIELYMCQGELYLHGTTKEKHVARNAFNKILEIDSDNQKAKDYLMKVELALGLTPKGYKLGH